MTSGGGSGGAGTGGATSAATGGAPGTGGATLAGTGGAAAHGGAGAQGGAGFVRQDAGAAGGTPGAAGAGGKTGARDGGAATDGGSNSGSADAAASSLAKLNMFYLDVTGGRVLTANAQNPVARVLVASAGQGPDGVAVDVTSGHIYWTGMGVPAANDGFVMRSDLDGTNVKTLVPAGGTYTPKQIKLDLAGGKMYWSDREGMRVMRANLDGSSVEALVTTGQTDTDRMDNSRWCVGIALDLARGYIYWSQKGPANGHVGTLRRAHLAMPAGQTSITRTDIEILYDLLPEPIDIDLDLGAGYIYWTDRADNTVSRAPIEIPAGFTAATRKDRQILVSDVAVAIGVALDLSRGKVYYTSGSNGALGRANLDGTQNESLIPMAGNLTGIALGELP
ncbi:MAG TPA: 3-hydroxyacyl-CoA dehydrogenase [Polyangia bacterium]|nr:3-hydroxyacyl-CoA dehydrogenase [Polyangia bacterium]